jgi:hypothetical protein
MSFSAKINETPQTLLEEHRKLGGRLLMTIPFGASIEKMQGFVSIIGGRFSKEETLPMLTICVQNINGKNTVSTIVFNSDDHYIDFSEKLITDTAYNFEKSILDNTFEV